MGVVRADALLGSERSFAVGDRSLLVCDLACPVGAAGILGVVHLECVLVVELGGAVVHLCRLLVECRGAVVGVGCPLARAAPLLAVVRVLSPLRHSFSVLPNQRRLSEANRTDGRLVVA